MIPLGYSLSSVTAGFLYRGSEQRKEGADVGVGIVATRSDDCMHA